MIPWKNTEQFYGKIAIFLHWSIALLFVILIVLGLCMTAMPDGDDKWVLYALHKSFGVITAALIMFRILWRFFNPAPAMPERFAAKDIMIAHLVHFVLYALMIILPISGVIASQAGGYKISFFGLFNMPVILAKNTSLSEFAEQVHVICVYIFFAAFALHILGVLKHHLIEKDSSLMVRMLPLKKWQ
ncbi:cytochrome b [Candidatus Venteria ishoeyi]|uniref:Cytochrome b561 bacterial/Ni-hydrogenase domain-containing protein n=1 Tax=Candidatus Venteria ishoeyi TaxID=1899563 RepID=A0A1H6F353_9GAMM|nr:cytochrome b [Candidatus Venteria ishoeyi]MDM8545660.1 cytochrome b [Candidatus Venteria ishoeyi]SEH04550.1 Uncharacterised protein [Candidatus Venteria ishoeyi]